ncbi:MAG TPA: hypothetical protein VFS23_02765 [Vicinamibacterales bacterium]|nr:hypothetical protein [Vicinamibacterales bacterium]
MIIAALLIAGSLASASQSPPPPPPRPTLDQIKSQLTDYEALAKKKGSPDPAALEKVARLSLDRAMGSPVANVWIEACRTAFAKGQASCDSRLWQLIGSVKAPVGQRVKAAAALTERGDKKAFELLLPAIKALDANTLAGIAGDLEALPESERAPLFVRMLQAEPAATREAACRAIGLDAPGEVRQAIGTAVNAIPPGTEPWFACVIAQARLREPDATWKLPGLSSAVQGRTLLDIADTMLALDDVRGLDVARKVTRQATGVVQTQAGQRLAETDPAYVGGLAEARLADPAPSVRAEALIIERKLGRAPYPAVRAALLDKDEIVQLRAAETVLAWAEKQRKLR